MKEIEPPIKMDLLDRTFAPTPKENKKTGRIASIIALVTGSVLTAGVVTAPLGIAILTVATTVSSGIAIYNGQKVDPSGEKVNFLAKLFQNIKNK